MTDLLVKAVPDIAWPDLGIGHHVLPVPVTDNASLARPGRAS
jgi:hypothetical protein